MKPTPTPDKLAQEARFRAQIAPGLAARLWAVVRANPTPSHLSLLRAQRELANVAVGHTPPDQTPTFDALALAFPQVAQAKAKAQAYALALQQDPVP